MLTNQKAQKSGGAMLMDLSYEYDRKQSVGTRNGKTGHLSKIVDNLNNNKNREYEYDPLGRLTKAKGGVNSLWTQSYLYDRFGNRTHVTESGVAANGSPMPRDGFTNLSYDITSNRITTSGFEYDAAGNQTRALSEDGQTYLRYEYDAANRLRVVKRDDGTLLQANTYSATNARVFSYDYGISQQTVYAILGGTTVSEYTENAPTVPRWTKSYVFIGDSLLSTATPNGAGGETTEYSHPDRLGTRVITNQQTGAVGEQATLPFGTALNAESTVTTNNKRFTSYDRSAATGLDYAINRHYDSKQGRFTQVDPIGMRSVSLSVPQTLNLYSYCGNDPINHTDPDGLFWGFFKKLFKWLMVALAVIVAVLTIVSVPATIAGIFAGISAGASAASTVLNALGYKKAGLIFGLIAVVTGFGSVIAANLGKGNSLVATGDAVKDGLGWIGALSGVGAVKNSFAKRGRKETPQQRRDRIWVDIYDNALQRLLKKPNCAAAIKGTTSYDPATILQTLRAKNKILYGGAGATNANGTINHGAIADAAGSQGEGGAIFLNDLFFDKSGSVGGWTARSTMNTRNTRTLVLLHELKHVVGGYGHPDTGNPTVDEADPESNTNWNKKIAKDCFGVTFN